jgi:hypothetical protein
MEQKDFAGVTHACPGGCGRQVARNQFACKGCWFRLPKPMRNAIWDGWNDKPGANHTRALSVAAAWYKKHPGVHDGH